MIVNMIYLRFGATGFACDLAKVSLRSGSTGKEEAFDLFLVLAQITPTVSSAVPDSNKVPDREMIHEEERTYQE